MLSFVLAVLSLKEVFAPVVVGVPPNFAARDLCRTEDGEIRHYGHDTSGAKPRRVYMASRDEGLNWRTQAAAEGDPGAMVKSPWSGEWIYFAGQDPVTLVRSKTGPGDVMATRMAMPWRRLELRQLTPLVSRKRWLAAFSNVTCADGECYHATTAYSDDDGRTWTRTDLKPVANVARMAPGDKRPHWFNDGCEPTFAELGDGTILLCVRTSGPHAAFYRSTDGGATWGEGTPDAAFWQANTMPYFFRLKDGRLLFIWNNTQMLPTRDASEYPELDAATLAGRWESVFTNRDALHAAISDDDGRTWRGFRELALNEIRNAADFRELGNGPFEENDKSIHQTQALELPDGKVLLAYGQGRAARRLMVLDPDWLLETSRHEEFRYGLGGLSTHLYVKSLSGGFRGWSGHCAWNRAPGALLVRDPDTDDPPPGGERSSREVLQLCRIRDPRLVSDRQGIVWNFPATRTGRLTLDCRIVGAGFRLSLADHWMNPCDESNPPLSPFSEKIEDARLRGPGWHKLTVAWSGEAAWILIDGRQVGTRRLASVPRFGLSYLHLQTLAEETDAKGTYFRSFDSCAAMDGDFSLSVRADLSSVTNAETLYEAPGSFTLKVREAGADPGLADYDRMLGNYLNWRLPDGRCPVIEAVVTDARRSIHPYYEKEFRGCRVGIPLALVKGGLGDVPVCISCTKTAWRIRIGDIEDEDFLVAPMKPLVAADANIRSDRVKSAVFGPADDRSEPVSRPVSNPIQYWTSGGFNTWVGDVVVANWRDRFHVFYLKDRRHHRSKGGSGGHYFAHVSSPDLVHWDEHPTVTPIEDHWFTCGTGTPFEFGGKFCLAYGVHSTRFVPRARTTEPRMLEELSRTGVMPSYRFAGTDLVPLGSTWAESMDGFVFRPSGIVFHTTQNPAITADPDGSLRLTTGFSEDTGVGGFWGSNGMAGWTKLPGEPPLKGDCPCPFEWNGRNYLLQGFRGYARQKGNGEWETLRGSDVYDGLNVPMVAPWKGDRRLLVGWVRHFYGWGGWLCFRELVQRPDGSLGTKWVPEIVPPSPIREFRLRAGEPFRLRFSGSAGALVELFVNPRDDEAAFADVCPDGTLDEPGDPPIGHSFRVTGIRGLDRDYAVRLVVHYDRKADATLLDAEIAGDRTIVCRRPGMYSPYDSLSM